MAGATPRMAGVAPRVRVAIQLVGVDTPRVEVAAQRVRSATRAGPNAIATDCPSERNMQYNHFSHTVYNSDCNIDGACNTIAIQENS